MKFLASLFLLASSVTAAVLDPSDTANSIPETYVPNKWIVEYSSGVISSKRSMNPHEAFSSHMEKRGILHDVLRVFSSQGLFTGATIAVADADILSVQSIPGVIRAYPVRLIPQPDFSPRPGSLAGIDTYTPHKMTNVSQLHNLGIKGKGVQVAIIDSGVDYNHPALGGCFGTGCKVVKGYDFVGNAYTGGTSTPVEGTDPIDCSGHGTHVAGIFGANDNVNNFTGVAPEATIAAYKVFGCTGSASNDVIIAAMLRAASEGSQIISMSLGGASGWSEDAVSVVASRIVAQGIVITAAEGNSGAEGLFYPSFPGTGDGVISVGAVDNLVTPGRYTLLSTTPPTPIFYDGTAAINVSSSTQYPIYLASNSTSTDSQGCTPFAVDLTGKVTVIKRGICTFTVKAQNVYNAGGRIVLFYNTANTALTATVTGVAVQSGTLTLTGGTNLVNAVVANPALTVSFPTGFYNFPNPTTGGLVSTLSSWGPTFDLKIKPTIAAPGGNILSTLPLSQGAYGVESGTSMSCPFISGVIALYIQKNGRIAPDTITSKLITSSHPVSTTVNGTLIQPVIQQGGGLVDAYAAVFSKTVVSPSGFALNDTTHAVTKSTFKIQNLGLLPKTYQISHVPAQTASTFSSSSIQPSLSPALAQNPAQVTFSSTSVLVWGLLSSQVTVKFTAPVSTPGNVPVYSGYIQIKSSDEVYTIPYAGVAASMHDNFPILDNTNYYFGSNLPALSDAEGAFVTAPRTFTFVNGDVPSVILRLIGGTAKLLIDLVAANTTFTPTIAKRDEGVDGRMTHVAKRAVPAAPISLAPLVQYSYNYRNLPDSTANGVGYQKYALSTSNTSFTYVTSDGTTVRVADGSYRVLIRGLKIFGDETKESDYESWLSPIITIAQQGTSSASSVTSSSASSSSSSSALASSAVVSVSVSVSTSTSTSAYASASASVSTSASASSSSAAPASSVSIVTTMQSSSSIVSSSVSATPTVARRASHKRQH